MKCDEIVLAVENKKTTHFQTKLYTKRKQRNEKKRSEMDGEWEGGKLPHRKKEKLITSHSTANPSMNNSKSWRSKPTWPRRVRSIVPTC